MTKPDRDNLKLIVKMLQASRELEHDLEVLADYDVFIMDEDIQAQHIITDNLISALDDTINNH